LPPVANLQRVPESASYDNSVFLGVSLRASQEKNEDHNRVTGHFPFSVLGTHLVAPSPQFLSDSACDSVSPTVFSRTEEALENVHFASTPCGQRSGNSTPSIWNMF
jgi:hypothetical protein